MPYTLQHRDSDDFGEVTFHGVVTAADLRDATVEAVQLQRRHSILRFLVVVDPVDMKAAADDLREIEKQYRQMEVRRFTRVAVIQPRDGVGRRLAAIYEDVCRQHGWDVKVLPDRKDALAWLSEAGS